ncbi:hypothetical protein BDN72DRAFT_495384 [Pluteus cervinus]|uniref:Uncharacterized protein n=1 Tax=Pluteus cervinus TaxID=181527 RepID=A0ACD3AZV7_9AGAR|nr:hypothetical protein BDN72DRAFT_495384 [Pluteus cervinus]
MQSSPVKKHSQKKRHTKPCKFYQTQTCQLSAEECDFLHIPPSPPQAPFCRYYLAGHCSNSDWCRYNHGCEQVHDSDSPGTLDATTTIVVGGNMSEPLSSSAGFSKPRPANVNVGAIIDHTTAPDMNKLAQREGGLGPPSKGPDEVSTALSVPMASMIISGVPMAPLVPVAPIAGLGPAEQATAPIPMYGIYPMMPVAHYPGYPETYYPQGAVHTLLRHPHLPRLQPSPHPSGHPPPPIFIPHAPVPAYPPSLDPGDHIYSTSPAPNATHSPKHSSEVQPQNVAIHGQESYFVNRQDPQYAEHGHVGQQSQIRVYDDTPIVHVPPIPVGSLAGQTVFAGGVGHFGNMNTMPHGTGKVPEGESKPRESRGLVNGGDDVSLEGKGVSTRRARSTSRSAARFKAVHYKSALFVST